MGKSTINGHFSIATLNYQRVWTTVKQLFKNLLQWLACWIQPKFCQLKQEPVKEQESAIESRNAMARDSPSYTECLNEKNVNI